MKVIAVVNTVAGTVGQDGCERMRHALASSGVANPQVVALDLAAGDEQVRRMMAYPHDLFVVWGGDGTHRTALNIVGRAASDLLLLPGGTMNLLSKWIHGDRSWDQILQDVLKSSQLRVLPAGEVQESRFFCALLAGVPALLAEARESLRHGDFGRAIQHVGVAFETVHHLHLVARVGNRTEPTKSFGKGANVVGALVGPLCHNGRMEAAALVLPSAFSAIEYVWSSFQSGWREMPGAQILPAEILTVSCDGGAAAPVVMDGEKVDVESEFSVEFVERGGACLVAT